MYESPHHSSNFANLNGLFNLTSTYRLESNFSSFYETFSNIYWTSNSTSKLYNETVDYLVDKSKFAAAIIGNCGGSSKRLELIKSLLSYIKVDVFGACGKPCPNKYSDNKAGECKDIVCKEYMFYFAFENSVCLDYATEKFFYILQKHPIVPVVLGGGRHSHYVSLV